MRIAWIGPFRDGGGVPGMGALLLDGLLGRGVFIDLFTAGDPAQMPQRIVSHPGLTLCRIQSKWQWNRWYSRKPFMAFLSGNIVRTREHSHLCQMLIERHRQEPYDCIFQISQMELFKLGRHLDELPPIVVYPCAHAAGELRWHRRESAYALQSESRSMHCIVRLFLMYRSHVQRRELKKPALVLGPSLRFNQLVSQDYGVEPGRMAVLRHPVAIRPPAGSRPRSGPFRLLFVARLSVRKGLEQIVELSHRLKDLAGTVEIQIVGDRTQWSDYTAHLKELNPLTSRYLGSYPHGKMTELYLDSDALLVPSMYEPGSLSVGEALSAGVVVIASDEVGPIEVLSPPCGRKFPAGDVSAFEARVRELLAELSADRGRWRALAVEQATLLFGPDKIAAELVALLAEASRDGRSRGG